MRHIDSILTTETISFNWWELGTEGIFEEHLEKLNKVAREHIKEKIEKGFVSGELPTQKYTSYNAMYTGYWEVKTTTKTK